ncbi:DUF3343 domain-containing protein [Listeria ilorinensis]|uniref:DUF3343 domain-containing protein n=1 Tax=Listeria ilorinensis TaxID=2867439 RepID=UPI001EF3EDCE|nr:DUF3343 domain-containing protein [Listeria ilorinensis]
MTFLISFPSTKLALKAEKSFQKQFEDSRMIPLPVQISASCGLAILTETEDKQAVWELGEEFSGTIYWKVGGEYQQLER